jgi:hypothetical protein
MMLALGIVAVLSLVFVGGFVLAAVLAAAAERDRLPPAGS